MSNGRYDLSLIGMALLCASCASMVTIEATSMLKNEGTIPSHVTYAVMPTTEVEKDPSFPGYARLVAKKMDERGFKESDAKSAKLAVYLAYGVTESTAAASSVAASPPMGNSGGMGPGGMGAGGSSGYGGSGGYGTSVSSQGAPTVKRFTSQMVVVVADLMKSRATGALVELWRGETMHTGAVGDLPAVAPLLVDANFRHFGETTATTVPHTFSEEEIKTVRENK